MKVCCCQFNIAWEHKPGNFSKVQTLLEAASLSAGSLVLLPEMFATGFSMNAAAIGERPPSSTETFLAGLARRHRVWILGGLVTLDGEGRARNEAVVFSPAGELAARYAKLFPFTLGGESLYYTAGTEIVVFPWQNCAVAPFICYDLRFPEVFREAVRRGAQLFAVIANWPTVREDHWVTLLRARAIENQAYVAGVNRCGTDPKLAYSGRSLIIDPHGRILADAKDRECLIEAEIDLSHLLSWRAEFPALKDRKRTTFTG